MNSNYLHFIIIVFLFIGRSNGQNSVIFHHLNTENGLSQNTVTCIMQDKKGFIWIGTQDGLNRYDGYNIKIFKNKPSDPQSLSDNFIFSIYEDSSGTLFIEAQSGKINKYNSYNESFELVSKDGLIFSRMKKSSILAIYFEDSDIKWYGGQRKDIGLIKENTKTGEIQTYLHSSEKSSLSNNRVYSVLKGKNNYLWIGTGAGLDRLDEKTGEFKHFKNNPSDPTSLSSNWVWPLFEDSKGNLWVGTVQGGLNRFNPQTNKFTSFINDPTNLKSISDNYITSIYEDMGGLIWVGTNSGGVNYFNPSKYAFEHYFKVPGKKNSLSDNKVFSMYADINGIYWIGSQNGGLDRFDYKNKSFKNYSYTQSRPNRPNSNFILVIQGDKAGNLWIGNYNSGLNFFNTKTESFKSYTHDPKNPNSISDNRIYSIFEDDYGIIWIGTYASGLDRLDKDKGKIRHYRSQANDSTSLSSDNVWSLAEDNKGRIWAGTFGGGINILDRSKNIFIHLINNPGDSKSLCDNNVLRVYRDTKGNMWVGTTKGLCRYFYETNSFKTYTEDDGLANNVVFGILEDNNGNLWISTNKGLSKFNPKTELFKNYYIEDGLQDNEFNQNAFAKDYKTGNLLFGGVNGFNVFNPKDIKGNTFVPPVIFTNLLRYNTDDKEGKPIIEKGIPERSKITLTYKDNIISLEFAALSYYNNNNNKYQYLLKGFNNNWIQLGEYNKITFTNLSQGDYVLKVKGSNNDGVWNEKSTSLDINVLPPWWQTKLAYTLYGVIFISIVFGLWKYDLDRREKKAKIRETELKIKATEAEKRAIEIENERKTKELEEARQLQLSMLPKEVPDLQNLEIAAFMRTATEVGGDYYDFIVHEDKVLNVAFGDATGHGLQAGTMVTLMKGFFTSDSARFKIDQFMNHCSALIKEIKLGRILMSFTFLRIENNIMNITSAGMPPIYYFNKYSGETEKILVKGMPLGAMRKYPYKVIDKELKTGDKILLFTDGLPEQENKEGIIFDYDRVKERFHSLVQMEPKMIIDKIVEEFDEWKGDVIQTDDISFVVIRVK